MTIMDVSPPASIQRALSNSIILDGIIPYLRLPDIFHLAKTSHGMRNLMFTAPRVFRRVDLSRCRGAYISANLRDSIDPGGTNWRAERMDENLTEEEFYAGPLRGVLAQFKRLQVLQDIHTLILDRLASVTVDVIHDLLTSPDYNVRFLSIRECFHVNQPRLQQLISYICRPGRPLGTPRLQGLYVFTPREGTSMVPFDLSYNFDTMGETPIPQPRDPSDNSTTWYAPNGEFLNLGHEQRSSWEETLQTCKGIISFDAVLCSHMHADMEPVLCPASREYLERNKPGIPPLATVSLGAGGCTSCGRAPKGAPVWGESDARDFPLLWPPPHSGKFIDAVRPPRRWARNGQALPQRLIVSCSWCLTDRHCNSCHQWWCSDCYDPRSLAMPVLTSGDLNRLTDAAQGFPPNLGEEEAVAETKRKVGEFKVLERLCVEYCLVGRSRIATSQNSGRRIHQPTNEEMKARTRAVLDQHRRFIESGEISWLPLA
jgi:hypothetical protein